MAKRKEYNLINLIIISLVVLLVGVFIGRLTKPTPPTPPPNVDFLTQGNNEEFTREVYASSFGLATDMECDRLTSLSENYLCQATNVEHMSDNKYKLTCYCAELSGHISSPHGTSSKS